MKLKKWSEWEIKSVNEEKRERNIYQESVAYSKSLPLEEKTIKATSASQSTEISLAFFNKPDLRLEKVTCLLILFSILFSCTRPLPIAPHSLTPISPGAIVKCLNWRRIEREVCCLRVQEKRVVIYRKRSKPLWKNKKEMSGFAKPGWFGRKRCRFLIG